jgi:hypothetical protein
MRLPPWMWKVIRSRKTKVALACSPFVLCAAVAAAYPVCGWIGRWQAKRFLAELEAAGHAVDPENYYVPASSQERDVFRHPAMIREQEDPRVKGLWDREVRMPGLVRSRPRIESHFATGSDVRAWFTPPEPDEKQAALRLLGELREATGRMKELRPALARPEAVWTVRWFANQYTKGKEVPEIASSKFRLRSLVRFESERVPLYLAAGDSSSASECVASMVKVCRHLLESRPSMISVLLADGMAAEIEKSAWEGVIRGAWTEKQLAMFEARLAALDPQASASLSFRGEAAFARWNSHAVLEEVSQARSRTELRWREGWEWNRERIAKRSRGVWRGLRPQGIDLMKWVEGERLFFAHMGTQGGLPRPRFTPGDLTLFRQQNAGSAKAFFVHNAGWYGEDEDLDASAWERLENFTTSVLRMETRIALTRTGVALERHRLENRVLPERLDVLVPRYLSAVPADPFDGQPLRYRVQADGSPHLWSIGQDLVDEGGLPHLERHTKGDLIWITRPIPGFTNKDLRR